MSRETGWYRVKLFESGDWRIAKYENANDQPYFKESQWWVCEYAKPWLESDLHKIDETPVNPVPAIETHTESYRRYIRSLDKVVMVDEITETRVVNDDFSMIDNDGNSIIEIESETRVAKEGDK